MYIDENFAGIENWGSAFEDSMATQPERIATLEEKVKGFELHKGISFSLFSLTVTGAVIWLGFITATLFTIGQRVAKIEGKLGNPLEATIKGLKSPDPVALNANLDLLSAQIAASSANHAVPKKENVAKLASTLKTVAAGHPNLSGTWKAVATLASYSTSTTVSVPRPNCDISQSPHIITKSEAPELDDAHFVNPTKGYVFRGCTLHMNNLPPGDLVTFTGHLTGSPNESDLTAGLFAAMIDCDIVLTDSGIGKSGILAFEATNCTFQFSIEKIPSEITQQFLLAALPTDSPGRLSVALKS